MLLLQMHNITKNNYGDEAVKKGIHKIINFDKSIMTDSGGYQVLEVWRPRSITTRYGKF